MFSTTSPSSEPLRSLLDPSPKALETSPSSEEVSDDEDGLLDLLLLLDLLFRLDLLAIIALEQYELRSCSILQARQCSTADAGELLRTDSPLLLPLILLLARAAIVVSNGILKSIWKG